MRLFATAVLVAAASLAAAVPAPAAFAPPGGPEVGILVSPSVVSWNVPAVISVRAGRSPGRVVRIEAERNGRWGLLDRVITGEEGIAHLRIRPRRNTRYRAVAYTDVATGPERVRVRPRVVTLMRGTRRSGTPATEGPPHRADGETGSGCTCGWSPPSAG